MASEEHLKLSAQIKSVHKSLRKRAKKCGPTDAWREHINNKDQLFSYCQAMKLLATEHWEPKLMQNTKNQEHRIAWSVQYCLEYFRDIKMRIHNREREQRIHESMSDSVLLEQTILKDIDSQQKIRLLDVGSCYNPFKEYNDFDVTAIDISPASPDVQNCDFLSASVINGNENEECHEHLFFVMSYDVIVFSLLLEYMPTSEQRITCCQKAYDILDTEGILIIITPDSKHVGANAKLMKNWRYTLALMGFTRIKYEKLVHITCMVFRKALFKDVTLRWATLHKEDYMTNAMFIPQDFNDFEDDSSANE